ncbi:hypothetical protein C5167_045853 [Papaver somniferum]|uniref:pyruvate kinase n=1 Tax=Papaver somniferum TaxID=3469 RepID=A0A4Y7LFK4_PAPSO|nr:plastidial pyruvate kinase 4, chloroplastic-like [Papaver somniferum]XP_026425248.1 plastidial pyruvate kinase 4, chloroplastic-like [Papaver somniferum]XP_026425249.1 plastidial pyruvate kinase 4, chloroplastic-like [Papaver somniferum]RZC83071.1 hypothetical protein C5167_045853 [Papaver somniferum]
MIISLWMMLHVLPLGLMKSQMSCQRHGLVIQGANFSDFSFLKTNKVFFGPTCKLYLASPVLSYPCSLQQLKQVRNQTKSHIVLANHNGNGEHEEGRSTPISDDQVFTSIFLASINNDSQENSAVNSSVSISHSQLNPKEHVVDLPVNRKNLLDRLKAVHLHISASEQWNLSRIELCHRNYLVSARNLIHYLALKCLDTEQLQEELSAIGLQNLETINPHVLASVYSGIQLLNNLESRLLDSEAEANSVDINHVFFGDSLKVSKHKNEDFSRTSLRRRAVSYKESLLGPIQDGKPSHIMATVGNEAIECETLLGDLLSNGTTIFRINCAHGVPSVWSEIIRRIKRSSKMLEKPCRILMDLAGPKLRTDRMKEGPSVMKISPKKDATGSVILPAQVWLSYIGFGSPPTHLSPDVVLFVDNKHLLSSLEVGDVLKFCDTRGRKRSLKISKKCPVFAGVGFMAECSRTSYVESGTKLRIKKKHGCSSVGKIVNVPAVEEFVRLKIGDLLIISRDPCLASNEGSPVGGPRVSCSSSYLYDSVKPGEPIAFDDGKIWGVIQGTSSSEIVVSITHASPKGSKLGPEKSINIPQSEIRFEGLTSKDLLDLEFIAEHADMVGFSFIRDVSDVIVLQQELEKRKLQKLGVVLKIETQGGFDKLPFLLLQAMHLPNPLGVMIARGDLAVECGWENLADIQEEILSICGAAHIPVIWATQVLESLVKSGLPTRAEITDVANGQRASCIMLNKGKYITGAVSTLDSILRSSGSQKMKSKLKSLLVPSQQH